MFGAEQSLGSIDRKRFDDIDIFAAAVPAFARITLGVFVGQHAALRFHHRAAGEIFRRDQLDVFALPFFFGDDCVVNLRVDFAQTAAWSARQTGFSRMRNIAHGDKWKRRRFARSNARLLRSVLQTRARWARRF